MSVAGSRPLRMHSVEERLVWQFVNSIECDLIHFIWCQPNRAFSSQIEVGAVPLHWGARNILSIR